MNRLAKGKNPKHSSDIFENRIAYLRQHKPREEGSLEIEIERKLVTLV